MMGNWKQESQHPSTNRSVRIRRCVSDNLFNGRNIMCFLEHTSVTSFKLSARIFTWTILSVFVLQDREKLSDEEVIKLLSNYSAT